MGHASDLFRQIFLWLSSPLLPPNFLRYCYHFLMLLVGPIGVYFLIKKVLLDEFDTNKKELASLIGATLYLFNLATIQIFCLPFEPYSAHFAFLPWLFLANLSFLYHQSKKTVIFLLVINLLAVTQGYIATFFLVYFIALSLIFLGILCVSVSEIHYESNDNINN